MRHSLWLLFLQGFLCSKKPLRINPNFLIAWKGSCVLIPCQINETLYSDKIKATAVVWYFEPHWDNTSYDFTGHLLFDSSRTAKDHMTPTSRRFQGRVRFVGDLSNRDCSLMVTQLQTNDSGMYGARVVASVGNYTWRQMLFDRATVDIQESPPEPRIEAVNVETQEQWITDVKCSVPYHCPGDPSVLTLRGLENHHLSPQSSTIEGGMIQIVISFVPTWEDDQKTLTCLLSSQDGTQRSKSTLELDVKYVPKDVQVDILNDLPIKEGDIVTLNCSVGSSIPKDNWYNWLKSDFHMTEMMYSGSKLLTFPATPGAGISYRCEACNIVGCTSSPAIPMDVHFAPKEVKIRQEPAGPIHEGRLVKLRCQVGMANPQNVNYTWYHNGNLLQLAYADEMLIISEAVLGHSGNYWCEVSNSRGTMRSSEITLHVICTLCNESPLSINPNSLTAWKGSCVLIPCQITEMSSFGPVNATAVAWYFEPVSDYIWHDYIGRLLYDSSKTSAEHVKLASPAFRGRVKFVGDLNNGDCSLMVTQLLTSDSGTYGARVVASVGRHPQRLKWFLNATVRIKGSPPKPKMEIIPAEIQEGRATQVICSVPYDCSSESITLTISDSEGNRLSSENATTENRMLQAVLSFEPTREDHGKKLRCFLKGKGWAKITQSALELDVKYAPKNVQVSFGNIHLPIKQGDAVVLRCDVGKSNPEDIWYNWLKSDSRTVEILYSGSTVLTFHATQGPVSSYTCEACNIIGCTSSSAVTVDVHFAPEEVQIWQEPKGQIHEGTEVKLRCEVGKANPQNFTYTWYHDGQQLQLDSASEMLLIQFVLPGHSGSYWCEVSNGVGTSRSSTLILKVLCTLCNESPLSMRFHSLTAWKGSCVSIPCQINEMYHFAKVNAIAVAWYFEPLGNNVQHKSNGHLLYDSSKTSEDLITLTSPDFRGQVRFVGDLSNRDCSLMVTQLQMNESGAYGARIVVSIGNQPWLLKWLLNATVKITGSPPKPKMEIIPAEIQEGMAAKVICSVPYDCPDESTTLTIRGLEGNSSSLQNTTIENRMIQKIVSFEPAWYDHGKMLRCLLRSQDGSQRSQSTMKLDVKFRPRGVIIVQEPEKLRVGQPLKMRCEVGLANPHNFTYTWYKNGQQLKLDSAAAFLTIQEVKLEDFAAYHCDVNNSVGTSRSSQFELDLLCE